MVKGGDSNVKNQKISSIIYADCAKFFAQKEISNEGIITVTAVDVSSSGKHATVWLGLINLDPQEFSRRISGLEKLLKHYFVKNESFQYVPNLHVKLDNSADGSQKVYNLLKQ